MILGGFDHRQIVFFGIYSKYWPIFISETLHMDATHNPLFSLNYPYMDSLNQKRGGMAQCGVVLVSLAISDAQGFD